LNTNLEDMETDDSASTTSDTGLAAATALSNAASKLMADDVIDDEGFFDKPAVSPDSGTSTPPPSNSDSETLSTEQESFIRLTSNSLTASAENTT
jgi:hypothetical protein